MQTKCYGYLNFNKRMNDEEYKKIFSSYIETHTPCPSTMNPTCISMHEFIAMVYSFLTRFN
jgi:hypothetical protein